MRAAAVIPGAYCVAWTFYGVVMVATGAAGPFTVVSLRTHLAKLERSERLAWMMLDQTVLRSAGTAGTLLLPMLTAPHPAAGFIAAGCGMVAAAAAAWVASSRLAGRGVSAEARAPELTWS